MSRLHHWHSQKGLREEETRKEGGEQTLSVPKRDLRGSRARNRDDAARGFRAAFRLRCAGFGIIFILHLGIRVVDQPLFRHICHLHIRILILSLNSCILFEESRGFLVRRQTTNWATEKGSVVFEFAFIVGKAVAAVIPIYAGGVAKEVFEILEGSIKEFGVAFVAPVRGWSAG
jgi:hypothetical protein